MLLNKTSRAGPEVRRAVNFWPAQARFREIYVLKNRRLHTYNDDAIIGRRQQSPADARVTRDSAVIPRLPSAAIFDTIEPKIAPFDPPTPKTLA